LRLLLDTHVVLWQAAGEDRLGPQAIRHLADADELRFSVVSFAEIGVKASVGKLDVPTGFADQVVGMGVRVLGLTAGHGLAVGRLPLRHRDPFDRLLIVQAQSEGLTLMTADRRIAGYDVATVDAAS
jgi:PIN domain nuclease of toxin-antitoxin system